MSDTGVAYVLCPACGDPASTYRVDSDGYMHYQHDISLTGRRPIECVSDYGRVMWYHLKASGDDCKWYYLKEQDDE